MKERSKKKSNRKKKAEQERANGRPAWLVENECTDREEQPQHAVECWPTTSEDSHLERQADR